MSDEIIKLLSSRWSFLIVDQDTGIDMIWDLVMGDPFIGEFDRYVHVEVHLEQELKRHG